MRTSAGGWLAVGLLFGCGPSPSEVIGPYDGSGGSSGSATGGSSGGPGTGSTGPIADGSAGSGTGMPTTMSETGTTAPVDPTTTDPDASSSGIPPVATGSSGDPGSSSGDPRPPSCDELFGLAADYELCMEDEGSCTFNVDPEGANCNMVCSAFGAGCIDSIDNPGKGQECENQGDFDCGTVSGEESTICVCAK